MASQQFQIQENAKDISQMKLVLYGDGNGNKGLIRKFDGQEAKMNVLIWLSSAILLAIIYALADKII